MEKDRRACVGPGELILGRFGSCNRVGFLGNYKYGFFVRNPSFFTSLSLFSLFCSLLSLTFSVFFSDWRMGFRRGGVGGAAARATSFLLFFLFSTSFLSLYSFPTLKIKESKPCPLDLNNTKRKRKRNLPLALFLTGSGSGMGIRL